MRSSRAPADQRCLSAAETKAPLRSMRKEPRPRAVNPWTSEIVAIGLMGTGCGSALPCGGFWLRFPILSNLALRGHEFSDTPAEKRGPLFDVLPASDHGFGSVDASTCWGTQQRKSKRYRTGTGLGLVGETRDLPCSGPGFNHSTPGGNAGPLPAPQRPVAHAPKKEVPMS